MTQVSTREQLQLYLEEHPVGKINKVILSKQLGVSRQHICKTLDNLGLCQKLEDEDLKEIELLDTFKDKARGPEYPEGSLKKRGEFKFRKFIRNSMNLFTDSIYMVHIDMSITYYMMKISRNIS